jgi:phosphoribosylanthranilate isomerase
MQPTKHPRVKICCITSVEEARLAVDQGASALGLVSSMPSGPGVIDEEIIAEIAASIPPAVSSFLLTSKQDARSIIAQQKKCRTNTVQLCDRIERKVYQQLRVSMPGIALVQVIHVIGREAIDEAIAVAPFVNAVLLDSGNPKASIKELGGTGRVHDWSISKAIREILSIPVFLAGGLRPDNVGRAVADVGPFCFDVCSGVRTDGRLDKDKLSRFFKEIREKEIVMP